MKLFIQIPCFNEEAALPVSLAALPKEVPGFDAVEVLVIDDGSTDRTIEVARRLGVRHVLELGANQGLALAFLAGLDYCLLHGADVIVNTDADNQYCAADIPLLTEPILARKADLVIGARPIASIRHFSPVKKALQRLGSAVVRFFSGTAVPDAPSGFRAMSRRAAAQFNVFSEYTYTLETIIQAGQKGMTVMSVPIRTNGDLRPSRLVKSIPSYVNRSIGTIIRIFMTYRPMKFFFILGLPPLLGGFCICLRWLWLHAFSPGDSGQHMPSLIAAAILLMAGFLLFVVGLLGDLLSVNRKLLEDIRFRLRRLENDAGPRPPER